MTKFEDTVGELMADEAEVEAWRDRAEDLHATTTLSERQAEVWALKELGYEHAEIAEIIGSTHSAVDNYSAIARQKREVARRTVEALTVEEDDDGEEAHAQALSRDDVVDTFGADPFDLLGHSVVQVVEDASRREDDVGLGGEVTSYYCAACDLLSPLASTFAGSECSGEDADEEDDGDDAEDAEGEEVSA